MDGIMLFFFLLSGCFFMGMLQSFLSSRRAGIYPPKNILKKRASILAVSGMVFFLLGLLFYLF
jgi:hypothetical protein